MSLACTGSLERRHEPASWTVSSALVLLGPRTSANIRDGREKRLSFMLLGKAKTSSGTAMQLVAVAEQDGGHTRRPYVPRAKDGCGPGHEPK